MVEVEGVALDVTRRGSGPPVVCLSAVGHDQRDFEALTDRLGDRFEFIAIDWPGHGGSGMDKEPASAARYADLLTAALDALGVPRPILIGNSIGGAAAIIHASRRPVRALVLCDSGGLVPVGAVTRAFCGMGEAMFRAGERRAWWYPRAFALYYRLVLPAPAAATRRGEIVADGSRMASVLRQVWASFARPDADLRDMAAALDIPIWVAWAKSDRVIPLGLCRRAINRMKRVTVATFVGGHSPFLEQPDAFAEGFLAFAAGLDGAGEGAD